MLSKIKYREGEFDNLMQYRNEFVLLLDSYIEEKENMSKNKMLGTIFDTIFHIGFSNMRDHLPSIKNIYLSVGESRNTTLRQLALLEKHNIVVRVHDSKDSRIKRIKLTDTFRLDFEKYIKTWIDTRIDR